MKALCTWDFRDEIEFGPLMCGAPASVKIRGFWYCEQHADEVERILALDALDEGPDTMEEL
jgi:hypothetical protein